MWFTNQFTHKVITWPGTEQSGASWKHSVTASYFLQSKVTYTFLMNPGKSCVWCQEFGGCILMRTRNENAFLGEKSTSAVSPSETLVNAWGTNSLQPTGDERSREILPHQFQPLKRTQRSPNPSPTPTTLEHLQGWWFHHILGSRVMMCITTFSKQIFFLLFHLTRSQCNSKPSALILQLSPGPRARPHFTTTSTDTWAPHRGRPGDSNRFSCMKATAPSPMERSSY